MDRKATRVEGHPARRGTVVSWLMAVAVLASPISARSDAVPSNARAGSPAIEPVLPSFVPADHALSFKSAKTGDGGDDSGALIDGRILPTAASPDLPAPAAPALGGGPSAAISEPAKSEAMIAPVPPSGPPPNEPIPDVIEAKNLFGAAKTASPLAARAIGTYARGCLSGAARLPDDGPAWQAMRLSRNRHWGHPELVKLVKRLADDAKEKDGWPGLLVGDLSQPRGGPMLTGHASHQIGLDADVWLSPMPDRRLSAKEREALSATSMLDETSVAVDPKKFTDNHVALIKRAAGYSKVERIFVHPAIKKSLCERAGEDRSWLGKVRPMYGHYYHFHIRIGCPAGFAGCKPQVPPPRTDGCGKEVEDWLARVTPRKGPAPPRPPGWKPPPPPPPVTVAHLPDACATVLEAGPDGIKIPKPPVATKLVPIAESRSVYMNSPALAPHLRRLQGQRSDAN